MSTLGKSGDEQETPRSNGSERWPRHALTVVAAAAVAIVILAIPPPDHERFAFVKLEVDGAFDEHELFGTGQDGGVPAEAEARFWVGVRSDAAASVRIVAIYADRTLESLTLNAAGQRQIDISGQREYAFGGYAVRATGNPGLTRDIDGFVIVAARRRIEDPLCNSALAAVAEEIRDAEEETLSEHLSGGLARRLHAATGVVLVPKR